MRRSPPRPRRNRVWPRALAVAAALLLVWFLWPADRTPPPAPPVKAANVGPVPDKPEQPRKLPLAKAVPPKAPPRPVEKEPPPLVRARRDLLLAAIRARAASLRPCVPPDASEVLVPVRLHVAKAGPVRSVDFTGQPPQRQLGDCVRRVAGAWNFADVELPSDVTLLATLVLTPGA
jgi:hypothetical protein